LINIADWLVEKQQLAYKLYHKQCLLSLDHEMFKKTVKLKKKTKKKGSRQSSAKSDPTPEPDPEEEDGNGETENPNDQLAINTLSTLDFKIEYDDFKLVSKDLGIPCTDARLHAICKLLDPDKTKKIDFRKFSPDFLTSHIE
jgi:hypothetical protein